jgi:hypothetical protein
MWMVYPGFLVPVVYHHHEYNSPSGAVKTAQAAALVTEGRTSLLSSIFTRVLGGYACSNARQRFSSRILFLSIKGEWA